MKTFAVLIEPKSYFCTPLRGDTLFGQLCWEIKEDSNLLGRNLEELLGDYSNKPFSVISDPLPSVKIEEKFCPVISKPCLPENFMSDLTDEEFVAQRKNLKKAKWSVLKEKLQNFKSCIWQREDEIIEKYSETKLDLPKKFSFSRPRVKNTINRLTNSTGSEQFAPFSQEEFFYHPGIKLMFFLSVESESLLEAFIKALKRIGSFGYGKKSSTGAGRFDIVKYWEFDLKKVGCDDPNACLTLGPSLPEKNIYLKEFFNPFVRFGKHGNKLGQSSLPFKNPVMLADTGSVLVPVNRSCFDKTYLGTGILNVSKIQPEAVLQGYTQFIPIRMEGFEHE